MKIYIYIYIIFFMCAQSVRTPAFEPPFMKLCLQSWFVLHVPLYQPTDSVAVMSQPAEERGHGRITMKTYYRYFTTEGGHLLTLLVLVVFIAAEVTYLWRGSESQYWQSLHTDSLDRVQLLMNGGTLTGEIKLIHLNVTLIQCIDRKIVIELSRWYRDGSGQTRKDTPT